MHNNKIKVGTQKYRVLEYLKIYDSITALEALTTLLVVDLAGVIRDLIDCGIPIKKEWERSGKTRYIRYSLAKEKTKETNSEKVAA